METRTMYRVEKFLPPECPKCRARFKQEGKDYSLLLGDIVGGRKRVRPLVGYTIIVCSHCENMTARLNLEDWQLGSREKAETLLEQGFVNLQEVKAVGSMAREYHAVHMKMPGIRVEGLGSDDLQEPQPIIRAAKEVREDEP
jgi:hypothetical protein